MIVQDHLNKATDAEDTQIVQTFTKPTTILAQEQGKAIYRGMFNIDAQKQLEFVNSFNSTNAWVDII